MRRFYAVAIAAAASTYALIAAGGLVRATDSGLGCPDWPLCFGKWMPPADLHAWIEHAHRLIAGVLVVPLVAAIVVATVSTFRRRDRAMLTAALLAGGLILVQALLGALVVLQRLAAELVTAHLATALAMLALLIFIADREVHGPMPTVRANPGLTHLVGFTLGAIVAQMLLGSWVTGHHAGLAYPDFPLMGGTLLPAISDTGQAVQIVHRIVAVVVVVLVAITLRGIRRRTASRMLRRIAALMAVLVVVQIGLGWLNVASRLSALFVVPHLAVGAALTGLSYWLLLATMRLEVPVDRRAVVPRAPEPVGAASGVN